MNRTLFGFIRKELTQSLRDPRMKFLLFLMPCVQMTLFGVAISNEVKNIRLAAAYDSKDYVMRDIYNRAVASQWFLPADKTVEKGSFHAHSIRKGRCRFDRSARRLHSGART